MNKHIFALLVVAWVISIFLIPSLASEKFIAPIAAPVAGSVPVSARAELDAMELNGKYHLENDIDLSDIAYSIQKRLRICGDFFRQVPIFRFSNALCIRGSGSGCMAEKRPQRPVGFG